MIAWVVNKILLGISRLRFAKQIHMMVLRSARGVLLIDI